MVGACATRIHDAKCFCQLAGAAVGLAFAAQGGIIIAGPATGHDERPIDDFWAFCHWASEASLCIGVGLGAVFLEIRACCPTVAQRFGAHFVSHLGLAVLYLWMGAYSCGGRIQMGGMLYQAIGEITGLAAWVVCLVHLLFSCCADPKEQPDDSGEEQESEDRAGAGDGPDASTSEPPIIGREVDEEAPATEARAEAPPQWNDAGASSS